MTSCPARAPSATPSGPNRTASTSGVSETQTTTTSRRRATSAGCRRAVDAEVVELRRPAGRPVPGGDLEARPGRGWRPSPRPSSRARGSRFARPLIASLAATLAAHASHRPEDPLMPLVAQLAALLAAAIHVWFFVLESVAVRRGRASRPGSGSGRAEQIAAVRPMAFNQGFYNLFLAIGIAAGIALIAAGADDSRAGGRPVRVRLHGRGRDRSCSRRAGGSSRRRSSSCCRRSSRSSRRS